MVKTMASNRGRAAALGDQRLRGVVDVCPVCLGCEAGGRR